MEWNFERTDGLACNEFLYRAIAIRSNLGFELAGLESWSFDFDTDELLPGSNEGGYLKNLEKYHGLRTTIVNKEKAEAISYIKALVQQNKVCVLWTDLYYTPWAGNRYLRRHWSHAIIIEGVKEDGFFCRDYYAEAGAVLPFDHMPNEAQIEIFDIVPPEVPITTYDQCAKTLQSVLQERIEDCHALDKMDQLAAMFDESFDIHERTRDAELFENSRLINSINRIGSCRFQFVLVLDYFDASFPGHGLKEFADRLRRCAVAWKSITGLLIKSYLVEDNKAIIRRVAEKVMEEKREETAICSDLLQHLQLTDGNVSSSSEEHEEQGLQPWHCQNISLETYFNHKVFGDARNSQHGRVGENEFLLIDELVQGGRLPYRGYEFRLADVVEGKVDNIECSGQTIPIHQKCAAISLAYLAEHAHQIDYLYVNGEHGQVRLDISVSALDFTPVLGDEIIWAGKGGEICDGKVGFHPVEKRLFAQTYLLSEEMEVESITLPMNLNIHIFGLNILQ